MTQLDSTLRSLDVLTSTQPSESQEAVEAAEAEEESIEAEMEGEARGRWSSQLFLRRRGFLKLGYP